MMWYIAAFAAFFVKGLCGFANTLVFTSVMAFAQANRSISPVELMLGYPANFLMAWRSRERLDRRMVFLCSLFMMLGAVPGALFLKNADASAVRVFFGGVVLFTAARMLFRSEKYDPSSGSGLMFTLSGLFSGFLCGLFGVGAIMAAYVERISADAESFRANISAVFFAENTLRIIIYIMTGIMTADALRTALFVLPAGICGLYAGIAFSRLFAENASRRIVIVPLVVSGISMIAMNL